MDTINSVLDELLEVKNQRNAAARMLRRLRKYLPILDALKDHCAEHNPRDCYCESCELYKDLQDFNNLIGEMEKWR